MNTLDANYINHIGFVIDSSTSMATHASNVIKVTDNQVEYLAQRSKELDQETRGTTYMFNESVKCVHYDKDVLRLPSLSKHYRAHGNTALIDATMQCIQDLEKTPELYGDHAFLIYVVTDGEENQSRRYGMHELSRKLQSLRDNWTVAVLVPNARGVYEAKRFGFSAQNISVWDTTSSKGFEEVGSVIRKATDNWMVGRSQGIRKASNLFQMDVTKLNAATVSKTLTRLMPNQFTLLFVDQDYPIREFIESRVGNYTTGSGFYQITKTETIQSGKQICVMDKNDGSVYTGLEARKLLGLPDSSARVKAADHDRYEIYVQSTSVNRKLIQGTKVLVLD